MNNSYIVTVIDNQTLRTLVTAEWEVAPEISDAELLVLAAGAITGCVETLGSTDVTTSIKLCAA